MADSLLQKKSPLCESEKARWREQIPLQIYLDLFNLLADSRGSGQAISLDRGNGIGPFSPTTAGEFEKLPGRP
jgi:hypothetical protein